MYSLDLAVLLLKPQFAHFFDAVITTALRLERRPNFDLMVLSLLLTRPRNSDARTVDLFHGFGLTSITVIWRGTRLSIGAVGVSVTSWFGEKCSKNFVDVQQPEYGIKSRCVSSGGGCGLITETSS